MHRKKMRFQLNYKVLTYFIVCLNLFFFTHCGHRFPPPTDLNQDQTIPEVSPIKADSDQIQPEASLVSIALDPVTSPFSVGDNLQLRVLGTYSDNSTANISSMVSWKSSLLSYASVSAAGVVTGLAPGSTTITASLNGFSASLNLTVIDHHIFITQKNGTNNVLSCSLIQSTGTIYNCSAVLTPAQNIGNPNQIILLGSYALIANLGTNRVVACSINADGSLSSSCNSSVSGTFSFASGIAISGTKAYVLNNGTVNGSISYCNLVGGNVVNSCSNVNSGPRYLNGIIYSGYLYANTNTGLCTSFINADGSLAACNMVAGTNFNVPFGLVARGTMLYVANSNSASTANAISYCTLDSGGSLSNCGYVTGSPSANAIGIATYGNYLYIGDYGGAKVHSCPLLTSTTLGTCTSLNVTDAASIAIN